MTFFYKKEQAENTAEYNLDTDLNILDIMYKRMNEQCAIPSRLRMNMPQLLMYLFTDESGPAAMQHGNKAKDLSSSLLSIVFVIVFGRSFIH